MRTKQFIFVFAMISSMTLIGQTKTYFPNLTRTAIDTSFGIFFNYDKDFTRFINKPCHELDKKDPLFCNDESSPEMSILVAKFKNNIVKDSVTISYSEGASADPEFIITNKKGKTMGNISCLEFYINGLGTIYTSGHVNNMYDRRRKFQLKSDTILEIVQPYNYVGLKGKTLKAITLYKDKVGTDIIAQLPKEYEIEILLADGKTEDYAADSYFLVKTDFGLVGWLRLTNDDQFGAVLKELFFAGD